MNKLSKDDIKVLMETVTNCDVEDSIILNLLDDSDEDDEDERILLELIKDTTRNKRKCIRDFFESVVPTYTEKEFITNFRIRKSLFEDLAEKFESSDVFEKIHEDNTMSSRKCMAIFLWFAGHEDCTFPKLADRFNVTMSCVSNIIHWVIVFISGLSPNLITWPNETEKQKSSEFFKSKAGFSKAIGCIDGTNIIIDPPSLNKDDYIDQNGNTSIILQGVCNEQKKFINVFIGYPGSCHDSWVYHNSSVNEKLSASSEDYYIFGDSAYPCTKNLLTPYKDNGHLTEDQKTFNAKLSSCHVLIEHCFAILKQRFRQLNYCKLKRIEKICHFIRACCVLHNIAGEDDLDFILDESVSQNEQLAFGETAEGSAVRDLICQEIVQNNNV